MTRQEAFAHLSRRLGELHEALCELRLIIDDHPREGDVAIVDMLGNRVDDLAGWVDDARAAADVGWTALAPPADAEGARRALSTAHERWNAALKRLASYDEVTDLAMFGRRRGGEWLRWTDGVLDGLRRCFAGMLDAGDALVSSWYELTAPAGVTAISLHASPPAREPAHEGG